MAPGKHAQRLGLLIGLLLSLSACASGPKPAAPPKLPYNSWYVGLAAPRHMEVWVETVDVLDQRGLAFFRVHGGVAGYTRNPEGWHNGGGKMKPINNVDLPERIFLRWQSLVEPQAYRIRIPIPQWVRDEMVKPERVFCAADQKNVTLYRNRITLGMAPGGIVKVWVGAGCLGFKEVGRFQAEIEPQGPYLNGNGIYYRAPNPKAQTYIDQHGIPYGTW
ncbi:hypothetical protein AWM79_22010 [Pseudomonas agarici]|uniref:DUF2931 domain-containing protein n=1 Tax=Pseudomonas agarici TaxID=46677 RepID=A0A0X1T6U5_PSEAA|nr:DUF2931 family protein [Pseudomonas agarici]AMB87806.1 hypothetical protein AWM79_22010 [Pseudomonas agarici]